LKYALSDQFWTALKTLRFEAGEETESDAGS
jgi:hypothetical protein